MSYECQVQEQPARPALSIRARMSIQDLPQLLGRGYGAIARYLGQLGEQPTGPAFSAYYNMDMQDLDVEIGFRTSNELPGRGDIQASEIPGGKVATCVRTSPYAEIQPAYDALLRWIIENGYGTTGVAYEIYLNDPSQTPPAELKTQIVLPLKTA